MKTPWREQPNDIPIGRTHLKRVPVTIQYKNHPENIVAGYALSHEILPNQVSFFAAQKFPVDEELTVFFHSSGEKKSLNVKMKHMHEQISSGRIMNAVPTEANPFPARKFYRCYTFVVSAEGVVKNTDEAKPAEEMFSSPTGIAASMDDVDSIINAGPVSEPAPEPIVAVAAPVEASTVETAPKAPVVDLFASDSPGSFELPEVGDITPVDMSVEEPKAA